MAASAIMALSSLGSAYAQSEASKIQGQFERQQADQNARLLKLQAKEMEEQGAKDAQAHRRKVSGMVGSQRAALAAQGINIDSGTAKDIQDETQMFGAEDAETIKINAYKQAWGVKQQAAQTSAQGRFSQITANNQAANTLLTGGMQAIGYGVEGLAKKGFYDPKKSTPSVKGGSAVNSRGPKTGGFDPSRTA